MKPYIPIVAPKLLALIGRLSPLGDGLANITLAPFIVSRARMSETDETHEGIHVLQQYECGLAGGLAAVPLVLALGVPWWAALLVALAGFLPFVGWFYLVYGATWLYWRVSCRNLVYEDLTPGAMAYFLIPFEREAYLYDQDGFAYFARRRWFGWLRITDAERKREGQELPEHLHRLLRGE